MARSCTPGRCAMSISVVTVSGTWLTTASIRRADAAYRPSSSLGVGALSPSSEQTHVHVCRVRRALEHRMKSGTMLCLSSHRPASGASRCPRSSSGRSWSATPPGQSALAWRMITRRRTWCELIAQAYPNPQAPIDVPRQHPARLGRHVWNPELDRVFRSGPDNNLGVLVEPVAPAADRADGVGEAAQL